VTSNIQGYDNLVMLIPTKTNIKHIQFIANNRQNNNKFINTNNY